MDACTARVFCVCRGVIHFCCSCDHQTPRCTQESHTPHDHPPLFPAGFGPRPRPPDGPVGDPGKIPQSPGLCRRVHDARPLVKGMDYRANTCHPQVNMGWTEKENNICNHHFCQVTEAVPSLDRHKQPMKYMLGYLGIGVDGKVRCAGLGSLVRVALSMVRGVSLPAP